MIEQYADFCVNTKRLYMSVHLHCGILLSVLTMFIHCFNPVHAPLQSASHRECSAVPHAYSHYPTARNPLSQSWFHYPASITPLSHIPNSVFLQPWLHYPISITLLSQYPTPFSYSHIIIILREIQWWSQNTKSKVQNKIDNISAWITT